MTDCVFALVGNPNCGKTTLFNALTGACQRVGNWPGVTVEKKTGQCWLGDKVVEVVDLPGTYSLDVADGGVSLDEQIARDYILQGQSDLVINIVDASNIERNLYLTSQLLDMGVPVVIALNMLDVATEKGIVIDIEALSVQLGCPVFSLVASKEKGVPEMQSQLAQYLGKVLPVGKPIKLGTDIELAISELQPLMTGQSTNSAAIRWYALKCLEGQFADDIEFSEQIVRTAKHHKELIENSKQEDLDILINSDRYAAVNRIMSVILHQKGEVNHRRSEVIDNFVLNRVLGLPIFFGVMYLLFWFSINFGSVFIDFFEIFTGALLVDGVHYLLDLWHAPPWLIALLANGIGGGIQTVSTFIPIIFSLFLFLSLLEDSGYMARAAFVVDRFMRFLGLPGKAFVPMLVGFGCNVPAIMAARTLDSEKDRLLTISMAPFMSCGARLPVYALFAAVFFPQNGQNIVFALYITGILAAIFTGLVMKRSLLGGKSTPFIMELPTYHLPSIKQILLRTWHRLRGFIFSAGKVIVVMVVILKMFSSIGTDGKFGYEGTSDSVLSKIGQFITPVFAPMGMSQDNWPAAVGIFTGILAKEAVVGTLDAMYSAIAELESSETNQEQPFDLLKGFSEAFASIAINLGNLWGWQTMPSIGELNNSGVGSEQPYKYLNAYSVMSSLFSSKSAVIAYLLMILLYTPCVSALGAIYKETSMAWTMFVAGWTFLLGYAVATIYYQISLFYAQPTVTLCWLISICLVMFATIGVMRRLGMTEIQSVSFKNDNVDFSCQESSQRRSCSC